MKTVVVPVDFGLWLRRALGLVALLLLATASARAGGFNTWPFITWWDSEPGDRAPTTTLFGPFFEETEGAQETIFSLRPLWTQFRDRERGTFEGHLLYPLVNVTFEDGDAFGNVYSLLSWTYAPSADYYALEAFPFLFFVNAADPDDSYAALWPLGGTLKQFFGRDRVDFILWPLYIRTADDRDEEVRYSMPWPFLQVLTGPNSSGWGLWPLYGHFQRDSDYDHTWALWPLYYRYYDKLDQEKPYFRTGFLPFYTTETAPGLLSESFGWPFGFGYTRAWGPRPDYRETRYLYPFFVQGRGEEKYVNRWLPLYTHEVRGEAWKRWYLWPLLKREGGTTGNGLTRDRTSLLYFLYWDETQRHPTRGFESRKTFVWPLFAYWDDGIDRRQFQMLDPLTVFFQRNQAVRENWTPLFALYRYDRRGEAVRHNVLWNLIVREHDRATGEGHLSIGPLYEQVDAGTRGHWAILKGLLGRSWGEGQRQGQGDSSRRWRLFWKTL